MIPPLMRFFLLDALYEHAVVQGSYIDCHLCLSSMLSFWISTGGALRLDG